MILSAVGTKFNLYSISNHSITDENTECLHLSDDRYNIQYALI